MTNRIPCVGFELQYSPLERDCVENLAQSVHPKTHEFTFDVIQEVTQGQEILMFFPTGKAQHNTYLPKYRNA